MQDYVVNKQLHISTDDLVAEHFAEKKHSQPGNYMDQSALVMGAMLYPEMLPEVDSEEKSLPNTAKKQLLTEPAGQLGTSYLKVTPSTTEVQLSGESAPAFFCQQLLQ